MFVVLKGSRGRFDSMLSAQGTSGKRFCHQLTTDGTLALQGGALVFTRDKLFASPSMAAMAVMGRSANGWVEWKTPQGQSLDEVKRQAVVEVWPK